MIETELEMLRNKCLLFNQFMVDKGGFPVEMQLPFLESDKLINKAYDDNNVKILKSLSRDIDDQILRHMPLSMALELKVVFRERLGINLEAVDKARLRAIDKLVKKGRISKVEEYELLINRIDEIYADINKADEVERLNRLFITFDEKN